ncbi:pantoate--beta-alanine ligase [Sphingomonas flavalba]|uniref:pantoate--beta-alanine ligase n=1 Tax=Sphingomonas flavalba TaxID=2559804 RepID=UPI00109DE0EB|nr:pantoate--beta-alanine ligase [Sphingomonas flavalba]
MQTIRQLAPLRKALAALRAEGTVALVPTMGALHAGHMALVAEARLHARHVVVSIFVNPTQFGPGEDLATYPRRPTADSNMLREAGVSLLWMPEAATMYPAGFATAVSVGGLTEAMDGAARPGHFDGVATVVTKLFNQVRPDVALFGEKDYQQLAMIRRMAADLDMGVKVIGVVTQRDADGVALSSRNAYLTEENRVKARALPRALGEAAMTIEKGGDPAEAIAHARAAIERAGFEAIDYLDLRDAETLAADPAPERPARLLVAARIDGTRLIDNLPIAPRG